MCYRLLLVGDDDCAVVAAFPESPFLSFVHRPDNDVKSPGLVFDFLAVVPSSYVAFVQSQPNCGSQYLAPLSATRPL